MSWFPGSYLISRRRFREAAEAIGARLSSIHIDAGVGLDLSIEVAQIGPPDLPAVIVSSGLHGVEGPVGAAIQIAWMNAQKFQPVPGHFILVHALNPYGFAMGRRVNEDNVDLNRNFLTSEDGYSPRTSPRPQVSVGNDYSRFNGLLNPAHPPRRFDPFRLRALGYLMREGRHQLQAAIVIGQYEYAKGLFFGGAERSQTFRAVHEHVDQWVGNAKAICHIDVHTGYGQFAQCQLLTQSLPDSHDYQWSKKAFGTSELVSTAANQRDAYQAQGTMGDWLVQRFAGRPYRFLTAEFGTFPALTVLGTLRAENQAFHFTSVGSALRAIKRQQLETCFCPVSPRWRSAVLERGLCLIEQARRGLEN